MTAFVTSLWKGCLNGHLTTRNRSGVVNYWPNISGLHSHGRNVCVSVAFLHSSLREASRKTKKPLSILQLLVRYSLEAGR